MRTITRSDERILSSDIFERGERVARVDHGQWSEPAREIPVYHRCQVLVVGGGPAGTAAAAAAAQAGADVTLLERYNHLGGLSTGGLVIWIDRMTDWTGQPVIRGFAEEVFARLPQDAYAGPAREDWGSTDAGKAAHWSQRTAAYHGIVTWSPTLDPERLKLLSQEMVIERGVKLVYHSWACIPIVEDVGGTPTVKGVVFESKEGRMAILADVVVDATGDGDLFARAGAAYDNDIEEADVHHCMNTAWMFAGVDMDRWIAFKAGQPDDFAAFMARGRETCGLFERPFVSWRNDVALFMGPRQSGYSALDVDDLTAVEVRSHRAMAAHLDYYRACGDAMIAAISGGARIATERQTGWNRQLRLTPLPVTTYFATKVITSYVMSAASIVLLYAAGLTFGVRIESAGRWISMTGLLLIGVLPFVALGIAIGHLLTTDAMVASWAPL